MTKALKDVLAALELAKEAAELRDQAWHAALQRLRLEHKGGCVELKPQSRASSWLCDLDCDAYKHNRLLDAVAREVRAAS